MGTCGRHVSLCVSLTSLVAEGQSIRIGSSSRYYKVSEAKEGLEMKEGALTPPRIDNKPVKKAKGEVVQCRHLLVKHKGSRNPTSWRTPKITRTKEEAIELLKGTK